jgi:hypothetical protein
MIPHNDFQFVIRNADVYLKFSALNPRVSVLDNVRAGLIGRQLNGINLFIRETDLARGFSDNFPDLIQVIKVGVKNNFAHLGSQKPPTSADGGGLFSKDAMAISTG